MCAHQLVMVNTAMEIGLFKNLNKSFKVTGSGTPTIALNSMLLQWQIMLLASFDYLLDDFFIYSRGSDTSLDQPYGINNVLNGVGLMTMPIQLQLRRTSCSGLEIHDLLNKRCDRHCNSTLISLTHSLTQLSFQWIDGTNITATFSEAGADTNHYHWEWNNKSSHEQQPQPVWIYDFNVGAWISESRHGVRHRGRRRPAGQPYKRQHYL